METGGRISSRRRWAGVSWAGVLLNQLGPLHSRGPESETSHSSQAASDVAASPRRGGGGGALPVASPLPSKCRNTEERRSLQEREETKAME